MIVVEKIMLFIFIIIGYFLVIEVVKGVDVGIRRFVD